MNAFSCKNVPPWSSVIMLFSIQMFINVQEQHRVSSFAPMTSFTSITNMIKKNNPSSQLQSHLNDNQIEFTIGYMNKHHRDVLKSFAQVFSPLGAIQVKKNAFSGGSYEIEDAKLVGIDYFGHDFDLSCDYGGGSGGGDDNGDRECRVGFLSVEATVQIRNEKHPRFEQVKVPLGESISPGTPLVPTAF